MNLTRFEQQLRELMPEVDKTADRMARLRHFLADTMAPSKNDNKQEWLSKASDQINKYKTEGIEQHHFTYFFVPDYRKWWKSRVSKARSEAAKRRKTRPTGSEAHEKAP